MVSYLSVSIDGILIGTALTVFGLNFAAVIGAMVVVLTMIPYIGIIICWVPAVLIAAFQWGDWTHPIIVTAIFIVIQNLEGLFYAPRIVGNYVGLHPMTVIVSIFVWGLIIGGVIGPLLAVPLTATLEGAFRTLRLGPAFARAVSADRNRSHDLKKSKCRLIVSAANSVYEREKWTDGRRDNAPSLGSTRAREARERPAIV